MVPTTSMYLCFLSILQCGVPGSAFTTFPSSTLATSRIKFHQKREQYHWHHINFGNGLHKSETTRINSSDSNNDDNQSSGEESSGSIIGTGNRNEETPKTKASQNERSSSIDLLNFLQSKINEGRLTPPPIRVDDTDLLLYDVFLLLNLSVSISFWVVHRMSITHVGSAFSEGSLLCILWILSGLYYGSFLDSALDGHYDPYKNDGKDSGPKAAGKLGLSTFVMTANLRILIALGEAVAEHRAVGVTDGEMLIPLEVAFGLVLMSVWRAVHSYSVPRI